MKQTALRPPSWNSHFREATALPWQLQNHGGDLTPCGGSPVSRATGSGEEVGWLQGPDAVGKEEPKARLGRATLVR